MGKTTHATIALLCLSASVGCNATIGGAGGAGGATSTSVGATTAVATGATSSSSTGATTGAGMSTTTSATGGGDPYAMARQICLDKINALRATKGLPAYSMWGVGTCVDQQATQDEMNNSPHGAWKSHAFSCNGNGQNECLGQGVAGIAACLDSMWAEGQQAACAGCDACADQYNPNCPNCDFLGTATGMTCGHYVNMSAKYFTEAACGFSSLGGWDAINFQ